MIGTPEKIMKGRKVSMVVKTGIRNGIFLPALSYTSEMWKWKASQQAHLRVVEMT